MSELSKQELYESVKTILETDYPHIHLNQHKLFTLFSIAFQYLLYIASKSPGGAYIIRTEDSLLADRLSKKSKDPSTRKFMQALLIPRKLTYNKSIFYLDFFHTGSWNLTKDVPREKLKGALIVKNTSTKPLNEMIGENHIDQGPDSLAETSQMGLPKNYFLNSLSEFIPRTITIAIDESFEGTQVVNFPFIKKESPRSLSGVTLGKGLDWDDID